MWIETEEERKNKRIQKKKPSFRPPPSWKMAFLLRIIGKVY